MTSRPLLAERLLSGEAELRPQHDSTDMQACLFRAKLRGKRRLRFVCRPLSRCRLPMQEKLQRSLSLTSSVSSFKSAVGWADSLDRGASPASLHSPGSGAAPAGEGASIASIAREPEATPVRSCAASQLLVLWRRAGLRLLCQASSWSCFRSSAAADDWLLRRRRQQAATLLWACGCGRPCATWSCRRAGRRTGACGTARPPTRSCACGCARASRCRLTPLRPSLPRVRPLADSDAGEPYMRQCGGKNAAMLLRRMLMLACSQQGGPASSPSCSSASCAWGCWRGSGGGAGPGRLC